MKISDESLRIILVNAFNENHNHHNIDSMDNFYSHGLRQIIQDTFKIEVITDNKRTSTPADREISSFNVRVDIMNATFGAPTYRETSSSATYNMFPNLARSNDLTYASSLKIDAVITAIANKHDGSNITKTASVKDLNICKVPVMVKSNLCHLRNLSEDMLSEVGEDPTDPGGYFIIKGFEWVIENLENIKYNSIRTYRNVGYGSEIARGEIISKPGDAFENSSEVIMTMFNNNQITAKLINQYTFKEGQELMFPFYTVFRILGITRDVDIVEHIVMEFDSELSQKIQTKLKNAFHCNYSELPKAREKYTQLDNIIYVGQFLDKLKYNYNDYGEVLGEGEVREEKIKLITNKLLETFDNHFLPHIGVGAGSRLAKARYFGHMLYRLILTEMQVIQNTDRDAYSNKRVHPPGVSFSKTFKSQYGHAIVNSLKRQIKMVLTSNTFANIDWATVFKQAINGNDFEKSLQQAITRSDANIRIGDRNFTNHLKAQMLLRKNPLTVLSTLRQITSSSNSASNKSSLRANEMRRVQGSYAGFICPIQSADTGENVGMAKQMAITATISSAGNSRILKELLLKEPEVLPLARTSPAQIYKDKLAKLMVNGEWIGSVQDSASFVKKCTDKRRAGLIERTTTIQWDFILDEICLWVDVGRIMRPLLIVYNTNDPYNPQQKKPKRGEKFEQNIAMTPTILSQFYSGEINNVDLQKLRIIEWISPEEQEHLLVAPSYADLMENRHNELNQYTHCEIPPAIVGLAALSDPYAEHDQTTRTCYQTNQIKIAGSWGCTNWQKRSSAKEEFLQYYLETPLVRTMTSQFINPCGLNIIVAIMFYGGYNQEDSIIFNKGSVERGLFTGSYFSNERVELEPKEEICEPNHSNTRDFNSNANYSKLVNGIVREGTILEEGDVIIAKRIPIDDDLVDGQYKYIDKSIIYKSAEPGIVQKVLEPVRNQNDVRICKVIWRNVRPVSVGDKFSSRHGQKGVCGMLYPQSDMPFTKSGLIPDVILNPHCMPSRMTIGQMIESLFSKLCAYHGYTTDGTIFSDVSVDKIGDELEKIGFDRHCEEKMYNGETGEEMLSTIFIAPTHYQRLQKFVSNSTYAINSGPISAITRQPVSGKASSGGLRLGEMERDALYANGTTTFLHEKFTTNSDGANMYICARCGSRDSVVVNKIKEIYKCRVCQDLADIREVPSTTSAKVFSQVTRGMNVGMVYTMKQPEFPEQL